MVPGRGLRMPQRCGLAVVGRRWCRFVQPGIAGDGTNQSNDDSH